MAEAAPLEVDLESFAGVVGGVSGVGSEAVVLDVRNPDEYESGHVPGAKLIPLGELAGRQDEIPDGDPIYVICASGGRSLTAATALVNAGYHAVSVAGGTKGWIEQGRPYVTGMEER
jgi:thioredoxin 1